MSARESFAWKALYTTLGMNSVGLLTIVGCNVLHWYCFGVVYYLSGALFLGVPLFILTLWGAPVGTFTHPRPPRAQRYRRLFFLNLTLVALVFLPAGIAVFFG